MGSSWSANVYTAYTKQFVNTLKEYVTSRKRKREENDSEDENSKIIDFEMHTPKKKKLLTTAKYIYHALFEEGKNSDVTVEAMGQQFNLHKIYLCQSPYFASMFGGSWLEAHKSYINIDIIDPKISIDSLKTIFGSLYNDEVILNPNEIVPILASATMFQLDGIIDKCREVMIETINPKSVMDYYDASCQYGDKKLHDACINWLLVNLMTFYYKASLNMLLTITIPLMTFLVNHPDLFVIQTEFSLYVLLKFWMYMHLNPYLNECPGAKEINLFYSSRSTETPFLLTSDGEKFLLAFQGLRIDSLISHNMDVDALLRDNIIPKSWLHPVLLKQWKIILRVNQNEDKGPSEEIANELFMSKSLRCGRILNERDRHMWRWTGFHYGVDLNMATDGSGLTVKRNHRPEFEQLLSFQVIRSIAIRVTVASLNRQRQVIHQQTTGVKNLKLSKTEEVQLLKFDKDITFPLLISVNILFTCTDEPSTLPTTMQTPQ